MANEAVATAFVGIGSNLDGPERRVRLALDALDGLPRTRVVRHSRLYRTAPWGRSEQPDFVNAVAEVSTVLAPRALLDALLALELAQGRLRDGTRWGPRTLDLDLVAYDAVRLVEPGLTVPHPRIAERAFVLLPLAEIAPDFDIPGVGRVRDLAAAVGEQGCRALD